MVPVVGSGLVVGPVVVLMLALDTLRMRMRMTVLVRVGMAVLGPIRVDVLVPMHMLVKVLVLGFAHGVSFSFKHTARRRLSPKRKRSRQDAGLKPGRTRSATSRKVDENGELDGNSAAVTAVASPRSTTMVFAPAEAHPQLAQGPPGATPARLIWASRRRTAGGAPSRFGPTGLLPPSLSPAKDRRGSWDRLCATHSLAYPCHGQSAFVAAIHFMPVDVVEKCVDVFRGRGTEIHLVGVLVHVHYQ